MKNLFATAVFLGLASFASAQDKKPADAKPAAQAAPAPPTVTSIVHRQFGSLERQFVGVAEAMPAEKFFFKPEGEGFKDVRTFAQQIGHVAANNYFFAAALTGEDAKITEEDRKNGPASLKTREDYLKYLEDSFAAAHKALDTVSEKNAVEQVAFPGMPNAKSPRLNVANILTWHGFDHYGQMVVYLRMNGVVPPASRN
jgi:uncharacterized damage-inducible protein DinB